jgi:L-malate glycosyltransferase
METIMIVASFPPLPAGGAEWQALRLGEELGRKGVKVTFLTPGKGAVKGKTSMHGMTVYRFTSLLSKAFDGLSAVRKTMQGKKAPVTTRTRIEYDDRRETTNEITRKAGWPTVIYYNIFYWHCLLFLWPRRRSFDIIHAHTMEWSAIVAARLGKFLHKPVVIKDSTMNGFRSLQRYPSGRSLQQMIIANAVFIAMTDAIAENLGQAGVPANKIYHIPNGIAVTGTTAQDQPVTIGEPPMPSTRTAAAVRVLFVGNLYQQPAKGIDILLKAWHMLTSRFPGALLDVVGDGDLPAYQAYAKQTGIDHTVRFLGKRSDTETFYREAAVFVLPSRREGMSNALMEAMLSGLPCVATDISGNQDLIRSGYNGLLVHPADVDALVKALGYMLSHPDEALEMGRNAQKTILEKCDIRVVADEYLSLYNKLL